MPMFHIFVKSVYMCMCVYLFVCVLPTKTFLSIRFLKKYENLPYFLLELLHFFFFFTLESLIHQEFFFSLVKETYEIKY